MHPMKAPMFKLKLFKICAFIRLLFLGSVISLQRQRIRHSSEITEPKHWSLMKMLILEEDYDDASELFMYLLTYIFCMQHYLSVCLYTDLGLLVWCHWYGLDWGPSNSTLKCALSAGRSPHDGWCCRWLPCQWTLMKDTCTARAEPEKYTHILVTKGYSCLR